MPTLGIENHPEHDFPIKQLTIKEFASCTAYATRNGPGSASEP